MELPDLAEAAVIADLNLDSAIARWAPTPHDGVNAKGAGTGDPGDGDDQALLIVVTAEDRGDWGGAPGAGIKLVGIQIELQQNVGLNPDTTLLSGIAEKISDRLPATHLADFSRHLAFCTSRFKVFRIESVEPERISDVDLSRERIIAREFICAQVA
jgi:hypothetical protein